MHLILVGKLRDYKSECVNVTYSKWSVMVTSSIGCLFRAETAPDEMRGVVINHPTTL